jgi:small subunit ribosomal protein S3
MGQKINPLSLRMGITRTWRSRWFASKQHFGDLLVEDVKIKELVRKKFYFAGLAPVEIERSGDEIKVIINAAKPGMVIGAKGRETEVLTTELMEMTKKKVSINVKEIEDPRVEPQLVAERIAAELGKKGSFRRSMKKAIEDTMSAGVQGMKVHVAGRLGGSEMSRTEHYTVGRLPLHTLRADIDYGFAEAATSYGRIGVKIWIYRGLKTVTKKGIQDGAKTKKS